MGFHRRSLDFESIKNSSLNSDEFRSFDLYMTGADSYSFGDELSHAIWNYYSGEEKYSRRNFWIVISEDPYFFDELEKYFKVISHPKNKGKHSEYIDRYANLFRIKWGEDPYKMKLINFLYEYRSTKSND